MDISVERTDWAARHGGVLRVWGSHAATLLQQSHVVVIGIGGVGCWTVEALARSGIGKLSLVDGDAVCTTNTNRQLIALESTVGIDKTAVMAERVRSINPDCEVFEYPFYYSERKEDWLLSLQADLVIDAIDALSAKCRLLDHCVRHHLPVLTSGAGGGKTDPSQIRTGDLGEAVRDPLLRYVRKKLRREYGFSRDLRVPFQIPCVYSLETPVYPWSDGQVCETPEPGSNTAMDCNEGMGATTMVTGSMGFALASLAIQTLLKPRVS